MTPLARKGSSSDLLRRTFSGDLILMRFYPVFSGEGEGGSSDLGAEAGPILETSSGGKGAFRIRVECPSEEKTSSTRSPFLLRRLLLAERREFPTEETAR